MSENNGSEDAGKWAIVQLMGHTRKAGKVYDIEKYGTQVMRLVVPAVGDVGEYTQDINWKNAGYDITYTTEDVVMTFLEQENARPPVILYQRPAPAKMLTSQYHPGTMYAHDDDGDDDLDDDDLDDDLEF